MESENSSVFDEDVLRKVRSYIERCRETSEGSRGKGRFPNLAGLCLALGVGIEAFEREMESRPQVRDMICTVLEDEAINFDPSTSMISTYLKKRLGYGDKSGGGHTSCEAGDLQVVFEHDIFEDGGS